MKSLSLVDLITTHISFAEIKGRYRCKENLKSMPRFQYFYCSFVVCVGLNRAKIETIPFLLQFIQYEPTK